jgi:hypothetical protein
MTTTPTQSNRLLPHGTFGTTSTSDLTNHLHDTKNPDSPRRPRRKSLIEDSCRSSWASAAIQGLNEKLEAENAKLHADHNTEIRALHDELSALKEQVAALAAISTR